MPRYARLESSTGFYHFINRGVNKKDLFHRGDDYKYYLELIRTYSWKFQVRVHHYCLMRNHTHLLLSAEAVTLLSRFAHYLQRKYAYYYCGVYHWSEQLFRKRFISIPIEKESYLLECARYIERNPLEAFVVKDLGKFPYSSYRAYAFCEANPLLTPSPFYEGLGHTEEERALSYRLYVTQSREYERIVEKIPF